MISRAVAAVSSAPFHFWTNVRSLYAFAFNPISTSETFWLRCTRVSNSYIPSNAQFRPQLIFLRIKESLELSRDFESVLSSAKG